jgi:hypothetical protein
MSIGPSEAVKQAHMTAQAYVIAAVRDLCDVLNIDQGQKDWRKQLEPFAPVLAAMITACAADYDTCARGHNYWSDT